MIFKSNRNQINDVPNTFVRYSIARSTKGKMKETNSHKASLPHDTESSFPVSQNIVGKEKRILVHEHDNTK